MNSQYMQAHDAIENEAKEQIAVALHTVIISLGTEKLAVSDRLADLTGNELFSSHGRALVNREQELYTAQKVLCELLVKEYRGRGRQQQCMSAARAEPAPVVHPHHCTARSADGACEECEGHAQAMREWKAEQEAAAQVRDMAVGLDRARNYAQADAQQIAYDEVVESIRERDEAEEFGDKLLDLVLGNDRPEWSSAYGTDDALLQVEERMAALEMQARTACVVTKEAKP